MNVYLDAKWNLFLYQRPDQHTLVSLSLFDQGFDFGSKVRALRSQLWVTTLVPVDYYDVCMRIGRSVNLVELKGMLRFTGIEAAPVRIAVLSFSDITFKENWVTVFAALLILQVMFHQCTYLATENYTLDHPSLLC